MLPWGSAALVNTEYQLKSHRHHKRSNLTDMHTVGFFWATLRSNLHSALHGVAGIGTPTEVSSV